jgi:hypothetical protein
MKRHFFPAAAAALLLSFNSHAFSQDQSHDEHHPDAGTAPAATQRVEATEPMAPGQMMSENCPMMKDPQMGAMHDLMHSNKIAVNVAEVDGGIIIKWSSADKETAKKLKAMGQNIKKMHTMMKGRSDMMNPDDMSNK